MYEDWCLEDSQVSKPGADEGDGPRYCHARYNMHSHIAMVATLRGDPGSSRQHGIGKDSWPAQPLNSRRRISRCMECWPDMCAGLSPYIFVVGQLCLLRAKVVIRHYLQMQDGQEQRPTTSSVQGPVPKRHTAASFSAGSAGALRASLLALSHVWSDRGTLGSRRKYEQKWGLEQR